MNVSKNFCKVCMVLLAAGVVSCSAARKEAIGYAVEQALLGPTIDKLTIMDNDFIKYEYNFLARYRISHEFWWGPDASFCSYGLKAHDQGWKSLPGGIVRPSHSLEKTGDMFERGGKIYQYEYLDPPNANHSIWREMDMSVYVLEKQPICKGKPEGYEFLIQLIDGSIFSVEKHVEEQKKIDQSTDWSWGESKTEKRGNNSWFVFRHMSTRQVHGYEKNQYEENWYLKVGDTNYYYAVTGGVISKELVPDDLAPPSLRTIRAGFERMLDSFVIEPIKKSPMMDNTQGGNS